MKKKEKRFKKTRRGNLKKYIFKTGKLNFGTVGLKALNSGILTAKQIESARQAIVRKTGRKGKLWIKVFPNIPITSKPTGSRMGKGKGSISHFGFKVRAGFILFELCGINFVNAKEAFKTGGAKLPIKTSITY